MTSKSLTPVDSSDFQLSPENAKIAFKNFGETDEIRRQSLDLMRNWIEKNSRIIHARLDSIHLLYFLRVKKFSVPKAQEAFERFLMLFYYENEGVYIVRNFNIQNEKHYDIILRG
jgi:hypothetical protein